MDADTMIAIRRARVNSRTAWTTGHRNNAQHQSNGLATGPTALGNDVPVIPAHRALTG